MNKQEFDRWMEVTKFSERRWTLDEITYRDKNEALWYGGGVAGTYIRITLDGTAEVGEYQDAIPHIGEAMFIPKFSRKVADNLNDASKYVLERLGVSFLLNWLC